MRQTLLRALFIDSWGWITLANRTELAFEKTKSLYQEALKEKIVIVTTDFVLDEVITFLYARIPTELAEKYIHEFIASIDKGLIRSERIDNHRFQKGWQLRLKLKDKPKISFTDLTSFVVMQELGINKAITNDRHFIEANLGFEIFP